jgi:probable HAF family extracellular repeat protein
MAFRGFVALCGLSLALGESAFAASPIYYLSDLGGTNNSYGYAVATANGAVEAAGRVNGASLPTTGDPAIWAGGTLTDLLTAVPGATSGSFLGIDSSGNAVGRAIIGGTVVTGIKNAFYLPAGGATATLLPVLNSASPYGAAYGISNNGIVTGYSTSTDAYHNAHAFVWTSAGEITDVGGLASDSASFAYGISPNGTYLAGYAYPTSGNNDSGWVPTVWTNSGSSWTCANVNPNPSVCKGEATAYAVNNNGDAVGTGYTNAAPDMSQNAFLFQHDGTVVNLGHLTTGIPDDQSLAINDSDVAVGKATVSTSDSHAFVWQSASGMKDLNHLLTPGGGAGWDLQSACGIDDAGHIVGYGTVSDGSTHAFLLTPTLPGDGNLDGKVDINDLTIVLANYGKTAGMDWTTGDFNGDGRVDINDLTIVLANYNQSLGSSASGLTAVPEPASLGLLLAATTAAALLLRRGRRHAGHGF